MTKKILEQVHKIVTENRLVGAQFSFTILQEHPQRGGINLFHNIHKAYLGQKYEAVVQQARKAGLPVEIRFKGKPNEIATISHSMAMPAAKAEAIIAQHKREGTNVGGFKKLAETILTI